MFFERLITSDKFERALSSILPTLLYKKYLSLFKLLKILTKIIELLTRKFSHRD
jgi:hypothetical protein